MKTKRSKNLLALAMVLLFWGAGHSLGQAQMSYFNEWYVPGQQYVRLKVADDGLYRVRMADLQAAGVGDLSGLNSGSLQLFYRGQEVPVYAEDSAGQFSFLEFVGHRNDGTIDTLLYRNPSNPFQHDPSQQPTPHRSLFTDTSTYFLTWDATNAVRYLTNTATNHADHAAAPYFRQLVQRDWFGGAYYPGGGGSDDVNHVLNPDYITGEGFISGEVTPTSIGDALAIIIATPGFANSGRPSRVEASVIAGTSTLHIFALDIDQIDRYRDTTSGINIGTFGFDYSLPLNPTTIFRFHAYGPTSGIIDKQRVGFMSIAYDRLFDLNNGRSARMHAWDEPDTTHIKVYNADFGSTAWILDPLGRNRIPATVAGDTLHFLVPGHPAERELYFFTDLAAVTPGIDPVASLDNLSDTTAGAEMVILTHRDFAASAQAYAEYRDTCTVNRLTTKVVYIDQVYDEFGYGSYTPWAIKNFCRYALEQWTVRPKHFMIWGKGRDCARCDRSNDFIPTFGVPANDLEYVTNMAYDTTDLVPAAGMGRVSIVSDAQGMAYLDKVDDYEHQAFQPFYKEVLMMGGGKNHPEQSTIFDYNVDKILPTFTGDPLNGQVYWYQKRNTGFQQNSDLPTDVHIDNGLGLLHYFGHSSTSVFELDLLEPNRYLNWHKYPFMAVFGCSGGNYAEAVQSYGERMLLEPQRGSIGYLGNTTSGFIQQLGEYGRRFYGAMCGPAYGASLGEIMQVCLADYCDDFEAGVNIYGAGTAKQMNLQGDPSIRLKHPVLPDLRITQPDIFFPIGMPQALDPEFDLGVILHNDGRGFLDSFAIRVVHRFPSGQLLTHDSIWHQPIQNIDTIIVRLPNAGGIANAGIHEFTVRIDQLDNVQELAETNNEAVQSQLFLGNLATPIVPMEYAIVPDATVKLQASALVMNLPSPLSYTFELDTVATFDSPFKKNSGPVDGTAALGEWPIGLAMTPGEVYYWRVRFTNTYPEAWSGSSFRHVPGRTGWSQSQPHQMSKDALTGLLLDLINRAWAFQRIESLLHALIDPFGKASYFLGVYGSDSDGGSGAFYTTINHRTLVPTVRRTLYGDWNFAAAPGGGDLRGVTQIVTMIGAMEPGDYFLLATNRNAHLPQWPDWALQAFEQVGGNYAELRGMQDGEYLLFFGQKGEAPGTAVQLIQPNDHPQGGTPSHDLLRVLGGNQESGTIASTTIGPSASWVEMEFDWGTVDGNLVGDSAWVDVVGIAPGGAETTLRTNLAEGRHALAGIDAQQYPRLRLEATLSDHAWQTAPQLRRWEVYYPTPPDLAIEASWGLQLPDSIEEGQRIDARFILRNLTDLPTDSCWVRYTLQDADRLVIDLGRKRVAPMQPRETRQVDFAANSAALGLESGLFNLVIEVNPGEEMPELHHFNNLYYHPLRVDADEVGPLVDVLIDGRHVMSGDIVSPEPEIVIELNDDNRYIPVTASDSTYHIWFGTERNYRLNRMIEIAGNDSLEMGPVRMPDNKNRLTFRPGRLPDGEYTLAVQAFDTKRNAADDEPYIIQMNVVNARTMTEVLPYPNPFSTACRFVFTLTGDQEPLQFDIEIYTITGRLVRVIDLLEAGDVHVGNNISAFAWDGTDAYGDPLANGVYLYRVKTKFADDGAVELRDEGISDYFRNGFGKMYLMR